MNDRANNKCPRERDDDEGEHASLIDEILRLERSTTAALRASRDEIQALRDAADEKRAAVRRMEDELDGIRRAIVVEVDGKCNNSINDIVGNFMPASGSVAGSFDGIWDCVASWAAGSGVGSVVGGSGHAATAATAPYSLVPSFRRRKTVSGGERPFFRMPDIHCRRSSEPTVPSSHEWTMLKMRARRRNDDNDDVDNDDDPIQWSSGFSGKKNHIIRSTSLGNFGYCHQDDDTLGENDNDDDGDDKERMPSGDRLILGDDNDSNDDNRQGRGRRKGGTDPPLSATTATATMVVSKNERIAQLMNVLQTTLDAKNEQIWELERRQAFSADHLSDLKSKLGTLEARYRSRWVEHASVVEGLQWRKQTLAEEVEKKEKLVTESERCLEKCERRIKILEGEIKEKTGGSCCMSWSAHGGEDCGGNKTSNITRLEREIRLYRLRLQVHSQYTARALQSFSHVIEAAKKNDTDGILLRKQDNFNSHAEEGSEGDENHVEELRRQYLVEDIALDVDIQLNGLEIMIKEIDSKVNEYKSLSSMDTDPAASLSTSAGGDARVDADNDDSITQHRHPNEYLP
jgi:hypothetical protein